MLADHDKLTQGNYASVKLCDIQPCVAKAAC